MPFIARDLAGLLAFTLLPLTSGALVWTTRTIAVTTAPFQTTHDATFDFQNTSNRPVTITDIQSSCDCLTVATDQKIYAPGASGVLRGKFTVGNRIGLHQRKITVMTDESDTPTDLLLAITVPSLATLTPQSVAWNLTDAPNSKTVDVKSTNDLEIVFSSVEVTNDTFIARLETVVAGQHYRLHLTPARPGQAANAAIRLHGQEKSGHNVEVSAYADVR